MSATSPSPSRWLRRLRKLVPGLVVLKNYDRSWLRGDVLAGITVAAYMIPQVMAYAEVVGLPAVVGLWALMGPLLTYAIVGSSRQLSVGPESTTALMTAMAIGSMSGDPATLAAVLALVTGVICIVAYLAKLGFLAGLLSRPVLIGYLTGIGGLMIISQLGKITDLSIDGETSWQQICSLAAQIDAIHWPTFWLAIGSVVALFILRALSASIPGPLLVILVAAGIVTFFGLDDMGVHTVGHVPAGLPAILLPDFTSDIPWGQLLPAALGIAAVGYSDNALTSRAFASRRREHVDANQELLALGIANLSTGLTSGFPVSSSGSRTVLGDSMGSRTQLFSLVALAGLIVTIFAFGDILAAFPRAALGGVVIYAAIRLVDVPEFKRMAKFRMGELMLAIITAVAVLAFDVLTGIGVAVALSILDLLRRIASPEAAVLGVAPALAGMVDINEYKYAEQLPGMVAFRYDSPIFFANAENFRRRAIGAVERAQQPVAWFLLNCEANTHLDLTAIDALEELRADLASRDIIFALTRVKQETEETLERAEFLQAIDGRVYPTLSSSVEAYAEWVQQTTGVRPPWIDILALEPTSAKQARAQAKWAERRAKSAKKRDVA